MKKVDEKEEKKIVKKENVNDNNKKNKKALDNKELLIGIVLVIAVIVGIVFLMTNSNNNGDGNNSKIDNSSENAVIEENTTDNKDEENNLEDEIEESVNVTEKDIIDAYSFSKEDAKDVVKKNFNSDNFEYTVKVSDDATYIVVAKNTINDLKYTFEVNPMNGKCVEILNSNE